LVPIVDCALGFDNGNLVNGRVSGADRGTSCGEVLSEINLIKAGSIFTDDVLQVLCPFLR
jgi:hypothetical protein